MNEPYLQVIAHFHAKPGNGDRVVELLAELAPLTRAEPKISTTRISGRRRIPTTS